MALFALGYNGYNWYINYDMPEAMGTRLQPEGLLHGLADFFSSEVPLENRPVRAEEDGKRYRVEAVRFSRDLLGVDDLVPDDPQLLGRLDGAAGERKRPARYLGGGAGGCCELASRDRDRSAVYRGAGSV